MLATIFVAPQLSDLLSEEDGSAVAERGAGYDLLIRLLAVKSILIRIYVLYVIATAPWSPAMPALALVTGIVSGTLGIVVAHRSLPIHGGILV